MKFRIPYWLFRLFFGKQADAIERRADLTGKASISKEKGPLSMTIEVRK